MSAFLVVLVVDDELDVREYAADVLREHGFLVAKAADAASALDFMRHIVVDILFTDIVMPGLMDGLDLAREARRLNPKIKIVCTTGFARCADEATPLPCQRLLRKPYGPDQLTLEIRRALAP